MDSKKTVRIYGLASFLHDTGSDMIFSIWPIFVTNVLGAPLWVLGLIDGIGDAFVSISQAVSGYLSDRLRKRKVFIWLGYFFGALAHLGYAISTTWGWLIPFRIFDRSGKMRGAPRDAVIADISTEENRGTNFGILRAMDNFGAVCGILLSLVLLRFLGYRTLFLVAAIPSFLAVLLIFFGTKESKPASKIYHGIRLKDFSRDFILFMIVNAFFALATFSYSFLMLYANKGGFPVISLPLLYLLFSSVASVTSYPFGKLADKVGRKKVLILSFLLWGLTCISFLYARNLGVLIVAFVLYGIHKGALEPAQKAFAAELSPIEFRASSLGGFQMIVGICALPASLVAGLLSNYYSLQAPFLLSLALMAISLILLVFVKERATV